VIQFVVTKKFTKNVLYRCFGSRGSRVQITPPRDYLWKLILFFNEGLGTVLISDNNLSGIQW